MAVPPNMLGFVESAGLAAVAYGPDSQEQLNPAADFVANLLPKTQNPISMLPEIIEHVSQVKAEKSATLTSLAKGADLLVAGFNEQGLAANVAEYLRHSAGCAALLPRARLGSPGTVVAHNEGDRRRPTPRTGPAGGNRTSTRRRWRSRPTTSSACPGRRPNGWNRMPDGPSSAR